MTQRSLPPVRELSIGQWFWAIEIPSLPDLLSSGRQSSVTGGIILEAFGRQIGLLRAIAAAAPRGTAIQLRFLADGSIPGEPLRTFLIGRAGSEVDALQLAALVVGALPSEYPLVPIDDIRLVLLPLDVDDLGPAHWSEVRRAIEHLDPVSDEDQNSLAGPADPVVLPWTWSPQALLSALQSLRAQPGRCLLIVHLEPASVSDELIDLLTSEAGIYRDYAKAEENPLVLSALAAYRKWLRELPRAALHLRVVVVSDRPLLPGLADLIGVDLSRSFEAHGGPNAVSGSFSVARPESTDDLETVYDLVDQLLSHPFAPPDSGPLAELLFLFDPSEAHTAFRLPITPEGGMPGLSTARLSTMPSGASASNETDEVRFEFGATADGRRFGITPEAVNRHVLVAGLPGFGKTTTVHELLDRLASRDVPFLVIDPAKTDYKTLVQSFAAEGRPVRHITLDPEAIGFNPLAVPAGSTPRSHGSRVLAAFDSAFRFSELAPAAYVVLGRAIFRAYDRAATGAGHPTLAELHASVGHTINRAGYGRELTSDLRAALLGRLELLGEGSMGRTLLAGADGGVDWATVAGEPTVIELRLYTAPMERALLFGLLVAGFVSYREANPVSTGLGHVVVLEEAHRVLGATERNGTPEGVRLFVDALAELRSSGQGFVVVEQAPSRLHPGVLKLTGTKIVHRIVDREERTVLGDSMLLDRAQTDDLARLPTGRAAIYGTEMEQPALVDIERSIVEPTDVDIRSVPSALSGETAYAPLFCSGCPQMCLGRTGLQHARRATALEGDHVARFEALVQDGLTPIEAWCAIAFLAAHTSPTPGHLENVRLRVRSAFFAAQKRRGDGA